MGKIRVKTFGDEEQEAKDKAEQELKRAGKKARLSADETAVQETSENQDVAGDSSGRAPDSAEFVRREERLERALAGGKDEAGPAIEETKPHSAKASRGKKAKFIKKKTRSTIYKTKLMEVEKNKIYSLPDALELLRKMQNLPRLTASQGGFDETVELHINTTEAGINGNVKLPHGTGKEIRVAIATDEVLAEVEKGKINFDVLIAAPSEMSKLAKVAKVLGPRGLMPNPKNGTISDNPEEAMKKFQGGQINFKTESKIPLIHLSIGKTSFGDKELAENIKTMIGAIKKDRIKNITLKSTMSPGIRLQV